MCVYGVRECSNFILLRVAVQSSEHHLLKRLSFLRLSLLHYIFLPPCHRRGEHRGEGLSPASCPDPWLCVSAFVPALSCLDDCSFVGASEVREADSFSSIFLSQDCFDYSGSFVAANKS